LESQPRRHYLILLLFFLILLVCLNLSLVPSLEPIVGAFLTFSFFFFVALSLCLAALLV